MIIIACVDERNGMMFNNRRQSRDRKLISHILKLIDGNNLWITNYSKELFKSEETSNIIIDDDFFDKIKKDEYCFIEDISPNSFVNKIEKIILYEWQRVYPADKYFDIDLSKWELECEEELVGSSHEKILQKRYIRRG